MVEIRTNDEALQNWAVDQGHITSPMQDGKPTVVREEPNAFLKWFGLDKKLIVVNDAKGEHLEYRKLKFGEWFDAVRGKLNNVTVSQVAKFCNSQETPFAHAKYLEKLYTHYTEQGLQQIEQTSGSQFASIAGKAKRAMELLRETKLDKNEWKNLCNQHPEAAYKLFLELPLKNKLGYLSSAIITYTEKEKTLETPTRNEFQKILNEMKNSMQKSDWYALISEDPIAALKMALVPNNGNHEIGVYLEQLNKFQNDTEDKLRTDPRNFTLKQALKTLKEYKLTEAENKILTPYLSSLQNPNLRGEELETWQDNKKVEALALPGVRWSEQHLQWLDEAEVRIKEKSDSKLFTALVNIAVHDEEPLSEPQALKLCSIAKKLSEDVSLKDYPYPAIDKIAGHVLEATIDTRFTNRDLKKRLAHIESTLESMLKQASTLKVSPESVKNTIMKVMDVIEGLHPNVEGRRRLALSKQVLDDHLRSITK